MNITVPLTPHLEQFLREQLATGRFQTQDEVVCAALRLLEDQSQGRHGKEAGTDLAAGVPRAASWEELRGRLNNPATGRAALNSPTRRSPRGILADIRSNVTLEDFREARHDAWATLSRGSAE
jgi:putative addiction module CopG family antidote